MNDMNLIIAEDRTWDESIEAGSWEDWIIVIEYDLSLSSIKEIEELIKNNMFYEFVQNDLHNRDALTYKESILTILDVEESEEEEEDDSIGTSKDLTYVIVVENTSVMSMM